MSQPTTTITISRNTRLRCGDVMRGPLSPRYGEIVSSDFDTMTATFRPVSWWRFTFLRLRAAWYAFHNVHEVRVP